MSTDYRNLSTRQWREAILGNEHTPPDGDALYGLTTAWSDGAEQAYGIVSSNDLERCEPSSLYGLTYLLCSICDLGPASIDPSAITDCHAFIAELRGRQSSKAGLRPVNASDSERQELRQLINRAYRVIGRMTHAWVALESPANLKPDGPVSDFRWRHDGRVTNERMRDGSWRMCDYLWKQDDRCSNFDDLKIPVFEDVEHIADSESYGSLRRDANKFFSDAGIPLSVSLKGKAVVLKAVKKI